jgi:hypothetical protein
MNLAHSDVSLYRVTLSLFACAVVIILSVHALQRHRKETFCAVTGYTYDHPGDLPDIADISRAPPFYDLNAVRPPSCSYKNYMFPPPMGYGPIDCPQTPIRYRYWDQALLSHPQTPYLV